MSSHLRCSGHHASTRIAEPAHTHPQITNTPHRKAPPIQSTPPHFHVRGRKFRPRNMFRGRRFQPRTWAMLKQLNQRPPCSRLKISTSNLCSRLKISSSEHVPRTKISASNMDVVRVLYGWVWFCGLCVRFVGVCVCGVVCIVVWFGVVCGWGWGCIRVRVD